MSDLKVRIVQMEPMRVASAHGFGTNPEEQAWNKILAFAKDKGIDTEEARFFGFNNPNPSPGSPNCSWSTANEVCAQFPAGPSDSRAF